MKVNLSAIMSRYGPIRDRAKQSQLFTFIFFLSLDMEVGAADMKHGYGSADADAERDIEREIGVVGNTDMAILPPTPPSSFYFLLFRLPLNSLSQPLKKFFVSFPVRSYFPFKR